MQQFAIQNTRIYNVVKKEFLDCGCLSVLFGHEKQTAAVKTQHLESHYTHIYFLNIFHIFSLVCFLIYSVNSSSKHDRSPTFG